MSEIVKEPLPLEPPGDAPASAWQDYFSEVAAIRKRTFSIDVAMAADAVLAKLKFNPYHEPAGAVSEEGEPAGGRFADKPEGESELPLEGGVAYGEPELHFPEGTQSIPVFHGTTKEVWANIKENGLVPAASKGADEWARRHDMFAAQEFTAGERRHSVYVADSPGHALQFAKLAAEVRQQTPTVLRIEIPVASALMNLHADLAEDEEQLKRQGGFSMMRYEGRIRPGWIKEQIRVPKSILKNTGQAEIIKMKLARQEPDDATSVYLIVFDAQPDEFVAA